MKERYIKAYYEKDTEYLKEKMIYWYEALSNPDAHEKTIDAAEHAIEAIKYVLSNR